MGKKRTEIIIETERVILIKRRFESSTLRCEGCGAFVAAPLMDDSIQACGQREEPVRGSVRRQNMVCPGCGTPQAQSFT